MNYRYTYNTHLKTYCKQSLISPSIPGREPTNQSSPESTVKVNKYGNWWGNLGCSRLKTLLTEVYKNLGKKHPTNPEGLSTKAQVLSMGTEKSAFHSYFVSKLGTEWTHHFAHQMIMLHVYSFSTNIAAQNCKHYKSISLLLYCDICVLRHCNFNHS